MLVFELSFERPPDRGIRPKSGHRARRRRNHLRADQHSGDRAGFRRTGSHGHHDVSLSATRGLALRVHYQRRRRRLWDACLFVLLFWRGPTLGDATARFERLQRLLWETG
jgi:hypothetical protein